MSRYTCSCGFVYCAEDGSQNYCGSDECMNRHATMHEAWEAQQRSIPLENRTYRDSTGSIFSGSPKWCSSCEERVNVTSHVCKAKDKSIDVYDLIIKIGKRGNP